MGKTTNEEVYDKYSRIDELRSLLANTDWVNSKLSDKEIQMIEEGKTPEEIKEMKEAYRIEYQDIYEERKQAREELDRLLDEE